MRHIRPAYGTASEKRRDFWAGFVGNIILTVALLWLGTALQWAQLGLLQLPFQLALLLVLAFTRWYMAYGVLMSFAAAFLVVVAAAPVGFVTCLVVAPLGTNGLPLFLVAAVVALLPAALVLRAVDRGLRKEEPPAASPIDPPPQ